MWKKAILLLVAVVALGAGLVLAQPDGSGPPADPAPPAAGTAAPDPYVNFRVNPMYDPEVTPEMIAESERLRRVLDARDRGLAETAGDVPPTWPERLREGLAAAAAERERFLERMAAGFPEQRPTIVLPDAPACSRACGFIVGTCMATPDRAQREACREACVRGDLGDDWRVGRILEVRSCDHL